MERTLLTKFTNLFRRILISFLWALTLVHFPPILKRRKILILKSCLTTVKSGSCKVTNARWPTTVTVKSFLPWENKFTHGKIIRHSKIMLDKGKSFSNVKKEPPSVKRSPEDCGLRTKTCPPPSMYLQLLYIWPSQSRGYLDPNPNHKWFG